jgi:short-subunit dehydrogenase
MLDLPIETVDHAFQTNVLAVLRVTQAVAPIMAAQKSKGIIVNMGSIGGFMYVVCCAQDQLA